MLLSFFTLSLTLGACLGFKEAFQPGNSTHYNPEASKTFAVAPNELFYLSYADATHLKGFQGKDIVQLGDYYAYTKFGAVTDCNSPDFNHVDGILGFGLPVAHPVGPPPPSGGNAMAGGSSGFGSMIPGVKLPGIPHGAPKPTLPPPLLFALTHTAGAEERLERKKEIEAAAGAAETNGNNNNNNNEDDDKTDEAKKKAAPAPGTVQALEVGNYVRRRAFSFLSTDTAAELQLGGYDPASIDGHMFLTPSISASDYVTVGLSLKYNGEELLEFTTSNPRLAYLPAIMDSGTSCLVIPDSTLGGLLKDKPFSKWKSIVNDTAWPHVKESFFLNIAGATFEIPYDDWFLAKSNQSCIQRTPAGFSGILVGDVLFRRYLVLFDLTKFEEGRVLIGIAKQNKNYVPATKPEKVHDTLHKFPMGKKAGEVTSEEGKTRTVAGKALTSTDGTATHGTPPPHLQPPMAMDRIPIYNKEDTQYFINVSIGTPRQQFTVIFDTGSAVFGVFSKCAPNAPTYGNCMFGGLRSQGSPLINGVIMVACISLGCVLLGVVANVAVRRWHAQEEQSKLKKFKKTGRASSDTAFGPERLYGSFGKA